MKLPLHSLAKASMAALAFVGLLCTHSARADYVEIDSASAVGLGGASGGDVVRKIDNGDGTVDIIHIFTNTSGSATFAVPASSKINPGSMRALVVGGGGSGGSAMAGGGGGGGVIALDNLDMPLGSSATVTVGAGGARPESHGDGNVNAATQPPGLRGGDSVFAIVGGDTHTALGGGGGDSWAAEAAGDAAPGSGGGGSGNGSHTGGNGGTSSQGNNGGNGLSGSGDTGAGGGGGGGAASVGGIAARSSNVVTGGAGGNGAPYDISGETLYYGAGGGGGAAWGASNGANATGGLGGKSGDGTGDWGKGANRYATPGTTSSGVGKPVAGQDGFGGGGGGGSYVANDASNAKLGEGAKGGDGTVIVRYSISITPIHATGAVESEVGGEQVFVYTDTSTPGVFTLDGAAKVWVLAVGGGGAGANPTTLGANRGSGGGGGAGGFVENEALFLQAGTYTINVGAGGPAAPAATRTVGANGGSSSIYLGETEILTALGGGGGGVISVGNNGGSGGGGSRAAAARAGGSGTSGQGYAGGDGQNLEAGAGGGGAGGKGGDTLNDGVGGNGGDGKASLITGSEVWYAAGGGGGSRAGTGGTGGSGIGGNGGGAVSATAGKNGTGSGGGGGRMSDAGGAGGSGIVIIRVKTLMPAKPPASVELEYDGEDHVVYAGSDAVTIRSGSTVYSDISVKNVGEYTFTVSLKPGYSCWADGSTGDATCFVKVTPPVLVIRSLSVEGWQEGEAPSKPVLDTNIALADGEYTYLYSTSATGPWSSTVPTTVGDYFLTVQIGSSPNFLPPTATPPVVPFSIWAWEAGDKYLEELGYHAKLTIVGYEGEPVSDFPMLVKVREGMPSGFRYKYTNGKYQTGGIDALDLRFIDSETGDILPFEIERWDESGESLFWVKMPTYANGRSITMCWGELVGKDIPATPAATEVWSDYVGVWHMAEEHGNVADSTGHGFVGVPTGSKKDEMIGVEGVTGLARINATVVDQTGANSGYLVIPNYNSQNVGGVFTYSGWYKADRANGYQRLVSRKNTHTEDGGWEVEMNNGSTTAINARGAKNDDGKTLPNAKVPDITKGWLHLTLVFNGTMLSAYTNGALSATTNNINAAKDNGRALVLGSNVGGGERSFMGRYDECRLYKGVLSPGRIEAEYGQAAVEGYHVWGRMLITPNSCFKNRWLVEPSISKTEWPEGAPNGIVSPGMPVYGESYWTFVPAIGAVLTNDYPTAVGDYGFGVFVDGATEAGGTRSWGGLEWDGGTVSITVSTPYQDLSGDAEGMTASGRVLLANDDPASGADTRVVGQEYDKTAPTDAARTYWVHDSTAGFSMYPKLRVGIEHTLLHNGGVDALCGATNIWYLDNVRLGNMFPRSLVMAASENYLPCSATAGGDATDTVSAMLRNEVDAAIYSPCYTNGIGTIYFDAVNQWVSEDGEGFHIVVEVATNCINVAGVPASDGRLPTDENVYRHTPASHTIEIVTNDVEGVEVVTEVTNFFPAVTERFGFADWKPVEMRPFVVSNGTVTAAEATEDLALAINVGGSDQNFYRVAVPLNYHCPARFRIRRTVRAGDENTDSDTDLILVDNVIASFPAMRADLSSYGVYDEERGGKQTLGQEAAWSVPFPSVDCGDILARAKPEYYDNPGYEADTSRFVTTAKMHYRWRYLEQKFDQWRTVALDADNGFKAGAPLVLPAGLPGDVEYWFELRLNAPFYDYFDYAYGAGGVGFGGLFTENISVVTNRRDSAEALLPSRGTDWFVRLREGASDFEGINLVVKMDGAFDNEGQSVTNTVEMELVADHIWRGYMKTLVETNYWGESLWAPTFSFRFEAQNRQTPGDTEWATNSVFWKLRGDAAYMPISETLVECQAEDWSAAPYDTTTGYYLFQIDDRTRSITAVHADYQNFMAWNDARGDLFVGNSTEDGSKSGASARSIAMRETFDTWNDMPSSNPMHWQESFNVTNNNDIGYEPYRTYAMAESPNGWSLGQGMFVYGNYRDPKTAMAYQLEGQGRGYLQFVDAAESPRGLESVSFTARLGQFINFEDFAYYDGDNKLSMSNYAFVARTAFDFNSTKDFSGNAILSAVAYYRPKVGCYEVRWEQIAANKTGSGVRGQRLCLYRWNLKGGKTRSTLVSAWTNNAFDAKLVTGIGSDKFAPLMLSVSNESDKAVCVIAAVKGSALTLANTTDISKNNHWFGICFRDNSADVLTSGTYGVLSTNCKGYFGRPELYKPFPSAQTGASVGLGSYKTFTWRTLTFSANPTMCFSAAGAESSWVIDDGRMAFYDSENTPYQRGLQAHVYPQTIGVYTATAGKTDWKLVATTNFSGFGSSTKSGETCSFKVYTTEDCSVKIAAAGDVSDVRTDIVIDDIVLNQWRGDDWDTVNSYTNIVPNWVSEADRTAHTNFVFTSAWVTNKSLLLSARRTRPGTPCSIRSPLFDGSYGRGKGLGMIAFKYRNAQENVNLLVQVATNVSYDTVQNLNNLDPLSWTTVTNFSFAGLSTSELKAGTRSCYIGLHDVKGVMRILMDPELVESVTNVADVARFGDIYIDEVLCRDEPLLDTSSWWGWNLRTVGGDGDEEKRMYLPDLTDDLEKSGLSLALNNSTTDDTEPMDEATYPEHLPFLQTPTFGTNIVGEVAFRARKYDGDEGSQPALVTLYGSTTGDESGAWRELHHFAVSNTTYTTYTYKTEQNDSFRAFRLVVIGVDGVTDERMIGSLPVEPSVESDFSYPYANPTRVLIDEVVVSEAVRAKVAFRNVGAFRNRDDDEALNRTTYVAGVPGEEWQPLCNEAWGVQCEVYAAQLPDEVDFSRTPRVRFHWFKGEYPWGFENWRTNSAAHSAWLSQATDSNLVFRASYLKAEDAIVPPSTMSGEVVQYALEVIWYPVGASLPATNTLSSADWQTPPWYAPVDKNKGADSFSAYNILDTVAPHWAWINEVNIFGEYDANYDNSDKNYQFIEVAVPQEADISGWKVELLEADTGNGLVITNTLGVFGEADLESMKPGNVGAASNMVFRVLANKMAKRSGRLKTDDGTLDGVWKVQYPTAKVSSEGEISPIDPVGIQLVRSSGVVEHQLVAMGTNYWASFDWYADIFSATTTVSYLNRNSDPSRFFHAGDDDGGQPNSLSYLSDRGGNEGSNNWSRVVECTPGRINIGQSINPDHPTPNGTSIIVYANLDNDFGHIVQTVGDAVMTNGNVLVFIKRGGDRGTNITYTVDNWYELGDVSVTTGGKTTHPGWTTNAAPARTYSINVGAGCSNNVTVVAKAKVKESLQAAGIDERYREAVLDWLSNHRTLRGEFANPDAEEVQLADFIPYSTWRNNQSAEAASKLTLTEMYWLDMDPTVGGLALVGGMSAAPTPAIVDGYQGSAAVTNVKMGVFMMITNRNDQAAVGAQTWWTPYVTRGLQPGSTSWEYTPDSTWNWTSATFKVTGILANGYTSENNSRNWIPLRWFVFHEDSFDQDTKTSMIEVRDPYGTETPGYSAGWKEWVDEHGYTPVFFSWALDKRLKPFTVEVLKKENYYND